MQNSSRAEFTAGVRSIFPLVFAALPIGFVFGTVAAGNGLSALETVLMSALVFAGGSQFVAMDLWTHPASWSALGFAALLVNLRHILMGASLQRSLGGFSLWQKVPALLVMADENWALAEARAIQVRLTPAYYLGLALPFYFSWVLASLGGALFGALLGNVAVFGLDFAFPAVFIVLLMGFWKGSETGLVLLASATASLTVHSITPGAWYIAAGAAAGLGVAFLSGRAQEVAA